MAGEIHRRSLNPTSRQRVAGSNPAAPTIYIFHPSHLEEISDSCLLLQCWSVPRIVPTQASEGILDCMLGGVYLSR